MRLNGTLFALCMVFVWLNERAFSQKYGTCDEPFIIFKHTVATSDSHRDCANAYHIFPDIHDEGASKFHDGQCAYQCKLELPYTCFKIHAPQTQFDEGLLPIDTFESKISEKWKHALTNNIYDVFFDNNMAFWVQSLDEYISHWNANDGVHLEYIGIEWTLDGIPIEDPNFKDNTFYSILLHSPSSAIQFEFISYTKPSSYRNLQWITDNIPRCTFKLMNDPYPWDREDGATIVPIRISHATTNINQLYDFYMNILEANFVYYAQSMDSQTKSIVMQLQNTHIEMQFVQRPKSLTYGTFALDMYQDLLMETHETIITSPYCGQDRWMDTHFAFETYVIPGLMDQIFSNLNRNVIKYTVHKNTYEHVSTYIKHQLDEVYGDQGYPGVYTFGLWVIEPTGQSIKIGGVISDPQVGYYANTNDPQWCPRECNWGLRVGEVDPSHVYTNDVDHDIRYDIRALSGVWYTHQQSYLVYTLLAVLSMILSYMIVYYGCQKEQCCNDYVSI
eukprot:124960_1